MKVKATVIVRVPQGSLRRMLLVDCTQGWLYHILTSSAKEGSDGWLLDDGWGMNHFLFVPDSRHLELNLNEKYY